MITRRQFIYAAGACYISSRSGRALATGIANPFTLGVASGSPTPTEMILWTRLAPDPLAGGGMPSGPIAVRYRVCTDPAMTQTVLDDEVMTDETKAHSVHVEAKGLLPGREYWYQFYFGEDESPVGRTRTADPNADSTTFALASCQNYESGQFAAFRDMAAWAPDCVIHVGDYLYEGGQGSLGEREIEYRGNRFVYKTVRQHNSAEISTLWDYRNRYALYRSDPHLQAAHAASAWVIAFDDHEVDNNWAAYTPQDPWAQTPLEFKVRRLAALQAFYEHMPIRRPPQLDGIKSELRLYDSYRFGPAKVHLLDTRQYRSDQVCGDGFPADKHCDARWDPQRSMTGAKQEKWLLRQLNKSAAPFNVLAQQTWFAPYQYEDSPDASAWNMDQWDGYAAQRERLIHALAEVSNPVVLSGDWHCAHAARIEQNEKGRPPRAIGHEFATTSISSHCPWYHKVEQARSLNPHTLYQNGQKRGYLRCEVSQRDWRSLYRVVKDPYSADSEVLNDQEISTSQT